VSRPPASGLASSKHTHTHTHTHTRLTALCPGLPGWAGTRKVKPNWILLKQDTVSTIGIRWAICKSAPRSRQITTPVPHRSVFLQAGCPSCRPTNSVNALKASSKQSLYFICSLGSPRSLVSQSADCVMRPSSIRQWNVSYNSTVLWVETIRAEDCGPPDGASACSTTGTTLTYRRTSKIWLRRSCRQFYTSR